MSVRTGSYRTNSKKRIVVIGIGYVGLPAALMWAKAGMSVVGVDTDESVVRAVNKGSMTHGERELQDLMHEPRVRANLVARTTPCRGDVYVVAVPTPIDPLKKVCDMGAIEAALESIIPFLRKGNLIVLESTVPPMTCRRVIQRLVEKKTQFKVPRDILVAHCPERILPGNVFAEIVNNDRLIGGMDARSTKAAAAIYGSFVKGHLYETDDVSAELSKLMENTYRDVNIALANEFAQICELLGADARKVISFANKHPRVQILTPGIGVGGHCIPIDPWFLKEVAPNNSKMITMARLVNDEMPNRVAEKVRRTVADVPMPRIVVLGATYKKNCNDRRESPAAEIVKLLKRDGYDIAHYDPLVRNMGFPSIEKIAKGADLIVVLVCHDSIKREVTNKRAAIERAMRSTRIVFFEE